MIAGDTPRDRIGRDGTQAFDLVGIFKPVTKLSVQANKTERIPQLVRDSFRTALWGKQGPVLLDIPLDLLDGQTISDDFLKPEAYRPVNNRTQGDSEAISRAAALLAQAERPLLLAYR